MPTAVSAPFCGVLTHLSSTPHIRNLQLVFRNPITTTGAVGSTVGIMGVLLYSLVKQHYDGQK